MRSFALLLPAALVGSAPFAGYAGRACTAPDAEVRIDHVVVAAQGLEAAQRDFMRLGLTPKPGRLHANGLLNAHFKFADGTAIEVMSVVGEPLDAMARDYAERVGDGGGGAFLSLGASRSRVLEVADSVGLDSEVMNAPPFRYVTFPGPAMAAVFTLEYERQFSEDRSYLQHPNGATGLTEVWLEAGKDLESLLLGLGAVFCGPAGDSEGGIGRSFAVQNGSVVLVDPPPQRRPGVLGVRVGTAGAAAESITRFPKLNGFWVGIGPSRRQRNSRVVGGDAHE